MAYDHQVWGSVAELATAGAAVLGVGSLWLLHTQVRDGRKALESTTAQIKLTKDELAVAAKQLVLAANQLTLATQEFTDDHVRSRKENAVNYLMAYARRDEPELAAVRTLVESLPKDACEALATPREFSVGAQHKEYLMICLQGAGAPADLREESGQFKLTFRQANRIRSLTMSYLNGLEGVLTAWREAVADRTIILDQFARHVVPTRNNPAFGVFCVAIRAEECYPSLTKFVKDVQDGMDANLLKKAEELGKVKGLTS